MQLFIHSNKFMVIALFTGILGLCIFIHNGWGIIFIRNHVGDIIATLFIYSLLSIFFQVKPLHKVILVLGIAVLIEIFQISDIFVPSNSSMFIHLTLGTTFDYIDILMYIIGVSLGYSIDRMHSL